MPKRSRQAIRVKWKLPAIKGKKIYRERGEKRLSEGWESMKNNYKPRNGWSVYISQHFLPSRGEKRMARERRKPPSPPPGRTKREEVLQRCIGQRPSATSSARLPASSPLVPLTSTCHSLHFIFFVLLFLIFLDVFPPSNLYISPTLPSHFLLLLHFPPVGRILSLSIYMRIEEIPRMKKEFIEKRSILHFTFS